MLGINSLAAERHAYKRLGDSPYFDGVGIRLGAPEVGKTGSDVSIYPYAVGPNGGPVGLEPIVSTPTIAVTRSYPLGDKDATRLAVEHVRRMNEVLHGSAGPNDYGLVVSCFFAREINRIESDASGKQWRRLGSLYEITVRSQS